MSSKQYRDQDYLVLLGTRIQEIIKETGKTKEDFAKICEIDSRQIRRIINAETNSSISILKKIADTLNITMSELLNF